MINIAFIIDRIWDSTGGTEKQLLLLLEHLDRKQFRPHLICLRDSAWLSSARLSYPVFVLDSISFKPVPFLKALRKFRAYCRENDIDVVQTFFRDGNLFGTIAAFLCRIRVIIASRRNYGHGYWHNRKWLFILRVLRRMTTHYICNSTMVADYTVSHEQARRSKVSVIYNGLVLDGFDRITPEYRVARREVLGYGPDEVVVGALASLRPVKNLSLFVETARLVYQKHQNARFIIVGEGPERPELEAMIDRHALNGVFRLPGQQEDVVAFLAAMDIGVLCSTAESLSNAIIEYTAAGLPCVVSDVGGNTEAMGPNGSYAFESNNSGEFSEKLEKLIQDKKLRGEIGRGSRTYAYETYDHKVMVRKHQDLYESLL